MKSIQDEISTKQKVFAFVKDYLEEKRMKELPILR